MKRVLHYESYGDICIVLRFKMVNLLVFYATFILDIWLWKISCLHLNSIWNPAGNSHFQWPMLAFACFIMRTFTMTTVSCIGSQIVVS